MRVLKTALGLKTALQENQGQTVALVPTMGALHSGHLSLIARAKAENDLVVVSIFVNPLQFGQGEDYQKYPRPIEQDIDLCQAFDVDILFAPSVEAMAINQGQQQSLVVPPEHLVANLCGPFRPGHFAGVTTIVCKLFNIVQPNVAYFGEKDFQQLVILKKMVEDLRLPVIIKGCPTVQDPSGLALSSRNVYLNEQQKAQASGINTSLMLAKEAFSSGERKSSPLLTIVKQSLVQISPKFKLQYLELVDPNNLKQLETIEDTGVIAIAGYFGSTRLIDNILLNAQKPIVTIDGPAGAGKSTVTRKLAKELGLLYLDTGAMYRAAAWLIKSQAIALEDHVAIAEVMASMQLELLPCDSSKYSCEVYLNQQRITEQIRSLEVTSLVSQIAAIASVRTVLVKLQKELGKKGGLIAEGRDMGTEVFPQASLKIFLTASVAERARRRFKDLQNQGIEKVSLEELIHQITQRDHQDSTRKISPLRKAQDAVEIICDDLNLDQVCVNIVDLYLNKINQK